MARVITNLFRPRSVQQELQHRLLLGSGGNRDTKKERRKCCARNKNQLATLLMAQCSHVTSFIIGPPEQLITRDWRNESSPCAAAEMMVFYFIFPCHWCFLLLIFARTVFFSFCFSSNFVFSFYK